MIKAGVSQPKSYLESLRIVLPKQYWSFADVWFVGKDIHRQDSTLSRDLDWLDVEVPSFDLLHADDSYGCSHCWFEW